MTVLQFKGLVESGDAFRCDDEEEPGAVLIGDQDVVGLIAQTTFTGPVTVAIADQRFTGDSLTADLGWGYSEYTPMDADELRVGDHDLLAILDRHVGKEVTMWVADEPIDLGA